MKSTIFVLIMTIAGAASAENIKLTLNWKAEPQFGGFYEAERLGLFKAKKLNVSLKEGGSGTPTIQMLAAGQTEYAIVSGDELVVAQDRGAKDLVAIYAVYHTSPYGIMAHADRGFKNLGDVFESEGTLLWQSGLPYAQFLAKKFKGMKVKAAPYAGGIGAFLSDKKISQQCFVTSEPLIAKKQGAKVTAFAVADSGYNPYATVVVTHRKRLEAHKEEVTAFVSSIREGWRSYLKDPEPANKVMSQFNKSMSPLEFAESANAQKDLIAYPEQAGDMSDLGHMTKSRWQILADQLFDLGLIKKKVTDASVFMGNLSAVKK